MKISEVATVRMFMPQPPNSHVENLMPIGDGEVGEWLGHEGEALMKGISALLKEAPENS